MRRILVAFVCIWCIVFLSACSDSPEVTSPSSGASSVTSKTDTNSIEPSATPVADEKTVQFCPKNSTSKYLEAAIEGLPEIIIDTAGSENGLPGTVYKFEGTVTTKDVAGENIPYVIVDTSIGQVSICDFYNAMLEESPLVYYYALEDGAEYYLPDVGETCVFYATYNGFSELFQLPVFDLGANEFYVEQYFTDASFLESNILDAIDFELADYSVERTETDASFEFSLEQTDNMDFADSVNALYDAAINSTNLFSLDIKELKIVCTQDKKNVFSWTSRNGDRTGTFSILASGYSYHSEEMAIETFTAQKTSDYVYSVYAGGGQHKIGSDIPAGEYMVLATDDSGYFCVSSDANGDDIIFNENFAENSIITVYDGEYLELSRAYAILTEEFYRNRTIELQKSGVMYKVGKDITPGEYKVICEEGENGYYCIYNSSRQDNIISNDLFESSAYVTVYDGQYLVLSRCYIGAEGENED